MNSTTQTAHLQPLAQLALDLHALLTELQDRRAAQAALASAQPNGPTLAERTRLMAKRAKEAAAEWSASRPQMSELLERTSLRLQAIDMGRDFGTRAQRQAANKIGQYYEGLARQLRAEPTVTVNLPELRPKNYTRNVFHLANGVFGAALYTAIDDRMVMLTIVAGYVAAMGSLELARRFSGRINRFLVDKLFASIARPSEAWRMNSATWYGIAVLIMMGVGFPRLSCIAAVLTLGIGDPMAALVGKRWGRHKLVGRKSLEGTVAFAISAALLVQAWLMVFFGDALTAAGGWTAALPMALVAGVAGGIAELYADRLEDNFLIPLVVAASTALLVP